MSEYVIECGYDVDDGLIPGELREEIVRCRDCELFATDGRWGVCTQFDFETTEENMRDGFCAWGVRRDG